MIPGLRLTCLIGNFYVAAFNTTCQSVTFYVNVCVLCRRAKPLVYGILDPLRGC